MVDVPHCISYLITGVVYCQQETQQSADGSLLPCALGCIFHREAQLIPSKTLETLCVPTLLWLPWYVPLSSVVWSLAGGVKPNSCQQLDHIFNSCAQVEEGWAQTSNSYSPREDRLGHGLKELLLEFSFNCSNHQQGEENDRSLRISAIMPLPFSVVYWWAE